MRAWDTLGRTNIESWNHRHNIRNDDLIHTYWWSRVSRQPESGEETAPRDEQREFAYGLPFRAMMWWKDLEVVRTGEATGDWHYEVTGIYEAWPLTSDPLDLEFGNKVLPRWPIWWGFAANTLIFAVLYGSVGYMLFVMRPTRRRLRGLCVRCGYSLNQLTSDRCPECGQPTSRPVSRAQRFMHVAAPLVLCAAAGIVTTIAVAQGCAYFVDVGKGTMRSAWSNPPPAPWHIMRHDAFGSTRLIWETDEEFHFFNRPPGTSDRLQQVTERQLSRETSSEPLAPAWSAVAAVPRDRLSDRTPGGIEEARGWPFRAFTWTRSNEQGRWQDVVGGLPFGPGNVQSNVPSAVELGTRAFPLRVWWPGFLANTLIYALVLYVAIVAWAWAKARARDRDIA